MATVAGSLRNKVLVVDDLTSGDITVTDLIVSGTVTLQGTATTLDSTNTTITDSIIELNSGLTGSNTKDIGFVFERGSTGNNAAFIWDESADRFTVITTTGTAADNTLSGTVANFQAGSFFGNGANLTSLSGTNISSGTVAAARIASLAASKITSGTFADARIPSLAASKITSGTFATARIPSLDTSKITSGLLGGDRIATGSSGDWWSGNAVKVGTDGVSEVGKYIDFHNTDAGTSDFDTRLESTGSSQLSINGSGRLFTDGYHPNADKWTTSRTLTLSGEASGSTSWDGSGNATLSVTLSDSALDNQYVTVGSRYSGNASALSAASRASIRLWDVSTATDAPSGASDGLITTAGWDSTSWATQQYHDFHSNDLYLRSKQNNTWMTSWDRVFHDTYHPNADTWTTARTITLAGDLTGNVSINGSANVTLTAAVVNDSHNHNHSDGNFTVNGVLQAGAGSNHISTSAAPFRWQRSASSQTGQDDNVSVYVDDSNIYFTHNNDSDGDASGYHFRYMTGGTATNLLNFSSSTMTYKGQTVFHTGYHPNADKWTTARSHTVTLTGEVTGTATQSVDGTGNKTWSIATTLGNTALNDQYIKRGTPSLTGNITTIASSSDIIRWNNVTTGRPASGQSNEYGPMLQMAYDGDKVSQLAHDFDQGNLYFRQLNTSTDTGTTWEQIFHDTYHPNADKWTTARTLTLSGEVTGSVSFDGSGAINMTNTVLNHGAYYLGVSTAETGRTVKESGLYTYNVHNNNLGTGTDTAYYSVMAWGAGTGGSAQLASKWTSNWDKLYFRSLRDTTNNWSDWREIYHTSHKPTYAELGTMAYSNLTGTPTIPAAVTNNNQLTNGAGYITDGNTNWNNQYGFITSSNSSITNKLPLAGGTMTGNIAMSNANITGVNQLEFNDPGEGIVFKAGSSGDMVLKIIDDSSDNILQYSGTGAVFDVQGQLKSTTTADATPALIATNSGGVGSVIAKFIGDSDSLEIQCGQGGNSGAGTGDYAILNTQQNNGLVFFDGSGGLDVIYNGAVVQSWDSAGGTRLISGTLQIPAKLEHAGDTDTYLQFDANRIRLFAGGTAKFDSNNTYLTSHQSLTSLMPKAGGTFTGGTTYNVAGDAITISSAAPQIRFSDTTSGADDFWIHVNSNIFYILGDRDDNGAWESPHPLELHSGTNIPYAFGNRLFTEAYHPNADTLTTARTIAGTSFNGSANIDISYNNLTNIPTNRVLKDSLTANSTSLITTFTSAASMNTASGGQSSLQVYNPTSGNDAFITFHVSGDYAFYFGLDGGTNKLSVGGWSMGANSYAIYHAGNKPTYAELGTMAYSNLTGTPTIPSTSGLAPIASPTFTGTVTTPNLTIGSGAKIKFANNDYIRYDDTPNTFHFDADGGSSNANLRMASMVATSDITIGDKVVHNGDTDTYMSFDVADQWKLYCGGYKMIQATEASSGYDYVSFGGTDNSGEIHFNINGGDGHFDGDVYAFSTTTSSDRKLKKNIQSLEGSLEKVLDLRGVSFEWKKNNKKSIGFIAQEVQEVVPDLVKNNKKEHDGVVTEEHLGVDYGNITALLVEAVKEQQALINRLEERIKTLESKSEK